MKMANLKNSKKTSKLTIRAKKESERKKVLKNVIKHS